jgi:hypothetical protein
MKSGNQVDQVWCCTIRVGIIRTGPSSALILVNADLIMHIAGLSVGQANTITDLKRTISIR